MIISPLFVLEFHAWKALEIPSSVSPKVLCGHYHSVLAHPCEDEHYLRGWSDFHRILLCNEHHSQDPIKLH